MKKSTKIVLTSLSILASTAMLAPLADSASADTTPVVANTNTAATNTVKAADTQTVTMTITKTGTSQPSEAASFLGDSATVTLKDGKVSSVTIHVDGSKSPMTKGQDLSKVVSSVSLNGQVGKVENVAQNGTSLDFVFDGSAYKEGKGTLTFTLSVMGKTMNESADVTLGAVKTTAASANTEANTNNTQTSENTTQTETKTSQTVKKSKKAKKTSKKAKAVKRTLKHNAYAYKKNGKRAGKKLYKKGKKVSTYGKAIKLHGKAYYRISKNTYIKKANF